MSWAGGRVGPQQPLYSPLPAACLPRSLWFDNNHNYAVYGHQKFKARSL